MASSSTTKMSSKGQVVIPEEIRQRLGLGEGVQFLVLGEGDVIILKCLSTPSMKDFDRLVKKARKEAKSARLKKADIARALREIRE
jgi:AbrB family looped-hinge helix DNA binding protein